MLRSDRWVGSKIKTYGVKWLKERLAYKESCFKTDAQMLYISTSECMLAHAFTLSKTMKNAWKLQKSTFFIVRMRDSHKAHARTWRKIGLPIYHTHLKSVFLSCLWEAHIQKCLNLHEIAEEQSALSVNQRLRVTPKC